MPRIARDQPPLWVHGHMHDAVDERLGYTSIANRHGDSRLEGHNFDPGLIIDP